MGNLPLVPLVMIALLVGGEAATPGAGACGGAGHLALASAGASRRVRVVMIALLIGGAAATPGADACGGSASRRVAAVVTPPASCWDCESAAVPLPPPRPIPSLAAQVPPIPSSCYPNSAGLASQLTEHCNVGNIRPSRQCCVVVLAVIDAQDTGCLCLVVEEAEFTKSDLRVSAIWRYYRACGGRQQQPQPPKDTDACEHVPAAAPPPPPPPSPTRSPPAPAPPKRSPKAASPSPLVIAISVAVSVVGGIGLLLGLAALVAFVKKKLRGTVEVPADRNGVPAASRVAKDARGQHLIQIAQQQPPAPANGEGQQQQEEAPVAGEGQQRAVARPPRLPVFAPTKLVKAPQAPRVIPPPLPLKVPAGASVTGSAV